MTSTHYTSLHLYHIIPLVCSASADESLRFWSIWNDNKSKSLVRKPTVQMGSPTFGSPNKSVIR